MANFPKPVPPRASKEALLKSNRQYRAYAEQARGVMESDHAAKLLMDAENGQLREQLFAKKNKPKKQRVGGAGARHMTSDENMEATALVEWKAKIKILNSSIQGTDWFKEKRAEADQGWKNLIAAEKARLKGIADAEKAREKQIVDDEKAREKAREKAIVDAEKAREKAEKEREKAIVDAEKARVKAEKARLKAIAEDERERKKEATAVKRAAAARKKLADAEEKERKQAARLAVSSSKPTRKRKRDELTDETDENTPQLQPPQKLPRPRPTPVSRPLSALEATGAVVLVERGPLMVMNPNIDPSLQ